ncbi:N-acetylglucosamine-6-phosphate deacetylase [Staphylococcus auricularis]|uniref:N-acetylglucosamine-6-phosphate deacetylase n=1 Tax=Staphylococcus auricularis TaxID=29379 RepID=A0AAW7MF96_9STAP|nr:N-acetylglucosamine-6-phosphate deacetylase [Staphylococcus auricularis]MDC6327815.1 N-acetylglucosamine-6-phosphate deacetylase [Staphylococcus auricularis]MDN4533992.1 N-acetylglucosamine-6-phosphate deacetylase [Staphylococcus auricularis]
MKQYVIINGVIYTETDVLDRGHIFINEGKIMQIEPGAYHGDLPTLDAQGHHVLPGFIDIHMHGGYGEDAMDASAQGLNHLATSLLSEGTTSFLATTMTQSDENIIRALETIAKYQAEQDHTEEAEIAGVHLEGPFISEHKVGAQNPAYVQRPTVEKIKQYQAAVNHLIKVMTFAPEVEGADEALRQLHDEIIFSIGHTVATYEGVTRAVEKGAQHITHLYNAATPFAHREPGVIGAAWHEQRLNTEIIVDGIHSHPTAVAIAYHQKGNQHFYLITDAMRAKGMPDGHYDLGGQDVVVQGAEARLANGALAGSILKMNEGLRNLMTYTGDDLESLWRVTSLNQAQALHIDDVKGSIATGKDADLVIVDDELTVKTTIKNGTIHTFENKE